MLIAALLTPTALAWEVMTVPGTDIEVAWYQTPIPYDIAEDEVLDDDSVEAVRASFERWSSVRGADVAFRGGQSVRRPGEAAMDDAQLVFVDHDWPYDDDVLALAATWADEGTGEMVHFDLRLNGHLDWGTDGHPDDYDLGTAVTHEIGHVLGLDHTDEVDAVMFAALEPGVVRSRLHDDDREALRYLYGADARPFACQSVGGSAGWLALSSMLLLWRRQR